MIILKSPAEIATITRACRIVAEALVYLRGLVRPGASTRELDEAAEAFIRHQGGRPAFKGYRPIWDAAFPATLCTSVNAEVVHGIPSSRRLQEGDIVGLDLGAVVDGYYGDAAITVPVGVVSPLAQRLLSVTENALQRGIAQATEGRRISDISHAIQTCVEQAGFSVVTQFVGHGIGRQLHEAPQIPNFGPPGRGDRLAAGMTLAIEPMVNAGGSAVRILEDRWTAVSEDGSLSAHFEHTIAVTSGGPVILTLAGEGEPIGSHAKR